MHHEPASATSRETNLLTLHMPVPFHSNPPLDKSTPTFPMKPERSTTSIWLQPKQRGGQADIVKPRVGFSDKTARKQTRSIYSFLFLPASAHRHWTNSQMKNANSRTALKFTQWINSALMPGSIFESRFNLVNGAKWFDIPTEVVSAVCIADIHWVNNVLAGRLRVGQYWPSIKLHSRTNSNKESRNPRR